MNNSNFTLRFSRSAREAYGHDSDFDRKNPDSFAWLAFVFGIGLLLGILL